jgi:hypothetical protein
MKHLMPRSFDAGTAPVFYRRGRSGVNFYIGFI